MTLTILLTLIDTVVRSRPSRRLWMVPRPLGSHLSRRCVDGTRVRQILDQTFRFALAAIGTARFAGVSI